MPPLKETDYFSVATNSHSNDHEHVAATCLGNTAAALFTQLLTTSPPTTAAVPAAELAATAPTTTTNHIDYLNMLLHLCSQRNVAHEMWRLLLLLYGLASVFLMSKSVCMATNKICLKLISTEK